jgi:hypothetical protein
LRILRVGASPSRFIMNPPMVHEKDRLPPI